MSSFADRLLCWFDVHGRKDLPWQQDPTPYRVWVSEIMLQQTQVTTVIPYYRRFMESFPDVRALATASRDDVLQHWAGLGYYARARNLHAAAGIIGERFGGGFPTDYDDVVSLPGVGRSTAGAILALATNQRFPILDGNVKRVLARYHAVSGWPGRSAVAKTLWEYAERHTPAERVAEYTQAIMDAGATLCTRGEPDCGRCPLNADCRAYAAGEQAMYPGKRDKKPKPVRSTVMVLAHTDVELYMERRPSTGIWGGLWSLPEISSRDSIDDWCVERLDAQPISVAERGTLRHSFTHFDLDIIAIEVRLAASSRKVADAEDECWYSLDSPLELGVAAPVKTLISDLAGSRSA